MSTPNPEPLTYTALATYPQLNLPLLSFSSVPATKGERVTIEVAAPLRTRPDDRIPWEAKPFFSFGPYFSFKGEATLNGKAIPNEDLHVDHHFEETGDAYTRLGTCS